MPKLFLSHSSEDKASAQQLRKGLEDRGVGVWEDALELTAGARLAELEQAVASGDGLLLLWTPEATESDWVDREVKWALAAERANSKFKILVLLAGGGKRNATRLLGEERVFIDVPGDVRDGVPGVLAALGLQAPPAANVQSFRPPPPVEELVIEFLEARMETGEGKRRAAGRFRIRHQPAAGPGSQSGWHPFESPLGPVEIEEIRWYLERYVDWPFGTFRDRALAVEAHLQRWGRQLFDATLGKSKGQVIAWSQSSTAARRVIVEVDPPVDTEEGDAERREGKDARLQLDPRRATAALLALPWELLADHAGYLCGGGLQAQVVRRIPRLQAQPPLLESNVLRVLLVIARPEDEAVRLIDPRVSARPLIGALAPLGDRAELVVLEDGTFPALRQALAVADDAERPFHVVHFDGHGVYDKQVGLGKLCFENPEDARVNQRRRRVELIGARSLGELLRARRVPLFVLEACQTAMAEEEVHASVAASLLQAGVGSVLAMTHSVLVETARRFVGCFYAALADGGRIGTALLRSTAQLRDNPVRGRVGGHGELVLHDWFVPVLFQESGGDVALVRGGTPGDAQALQENRGVREGELPDAPPHGFVGRGRELLAVQRALRDQRRLALLGEGGLGKTALSLECARWLLDLRRFERVAFASVEDLQDARVILDRLGRQLVPGYTVAEAEGTGDAAERLQRARLPIERVLRERRVLLIVDNLEAVLPAPGKPEPGGLAELLGLLRDFSEIGATRLLVTSREAPSQALAAVPLRLGRLDVREGRELVASVLARNGKSPAGDGDEPWVDALIEQVGGHARSLVLLAPRIAEQGLQVTTEALARIMAALDAAHPDARERSLLASVRLSLDRLPERAREQVRALAVFHGAAHVSVIAHVLACGVDEAAELCRQLLALGLAEVNGAFLHPDPALSAAVGGELASEDRQAMEDRWLEASLALLHFLYRQSLEDARVASQGTRAALADLLAALDFADARVEAGRLAAERAIAAVTELLPLAATLGRPAIDARLDSMRQRLEGRLGAWNHARFMSSRAELEHRLAAGDVGGALEAATELSRRVEGAGDTYPEAAFDRALASVNLGKCLQLAGRAREALEVLDRAERGFMDLAAAGDVAAAGTLANVSAERGDALTDLGRFDEAARAHERGIEIGEKYGKYQSVAVGRSQLGTIRLKQGRVEEALAAHQAALRTFEQLADRPSLAICWHQVGVSFQAAQQWDQAEAAYKRSLRINTELSNAAGQVTTLHQLATTCYEAERYEQAAQLFQQASTLCAELGDPCMRSGLLRSLAAVLRQLQRLDEARDAATEAERLGFPFGHVAQPWATWNMLHQIEIAAGHADAARAARARAIGLYAAYRRDGGEPRFQVGRLVAGVGEVLRLRGPAAARSVVPLAEECATSLLQLRQALLAIIDGSRDPRLAEDDRLGYDGAVELSLLLESLK